MQIRQIAQGVTNLERAVSFYSQLLGQDPTAVFNPPGLAFFKLGETRLLLDVNATPSNIYLQVEDVRKTVGNLRALGHKITTDPHVVFKDDSGLFDSPGDEWLAFIEDSEGNQVGLMSRQIG